MSTVAAVAAERLILAAKPAATALNKVLSRAEVHAGISTGLHALETAHARIAAIDAPGYTPYFEHLGCSALEARVRTGIVRHLARQFYRESQDKRVALSAFHDLAKRPRWHPALRRQVETLRDRCWNADFLDEACRQAGCPELKHELLGLLRETQEGDFSCGPRLIALAAQIAPFAPSPRGRPVRFETVLHRVFLCWSADAGGREGYTYDVDLEDFVDEATAATRTELSRRSFTPVAARYAERKHRARKKMKAEEQLE